LGPGDAESFDRRAVQAREIGKAAASGEKVGTAVSWETERVRLNAPLGARAGSSVDLYPVKPFHLTEALGVCSSDIAGGGREVVFRWTSGVATSVRSPLFGSCRLLKKIGGGEGKRLFRDKVGQGKTSGNLWKRKEKTS